MKWYENTKLESGKIYSHKSLVAILQRERPSLSTSTYRWAINGMLQDGMLSKKGYNEYSLSDGIKLSEYNPDYSDIANDLINLISRRYPYIQFTVFETALLNDFLNHMIAQNTIFIQAEKENSVFIFRFLQEAGYKNLMYKPSQKDFNLYWAKNSIIVTDIISEAPLKTSEPHMITLEKMLVDMCADKLIAGTYGKSEFPSVLENAQEHYQLDRKRMLRYARRRNKEEVIKKFLEIGHSRSQWEC